MKELVEESHKDILQKGIREVISINGLSSPIIEQGDVDGEIIKFSDGKSITISSPDTARIYKETEKTFGKVI